MAGTASPRSELRRAALARFLATASTARTVEITTLSPLRGGALQENWSLDARFSGGTLGGEQRLVLRTSAATGVAASLTRQQEFAVQKAAFAAGVTVPEPLFASQDTAVWGKPFFIMRRVDGIAAPDRITVDPTLDPMLPAIAERLGRELARVHTIRPPRPDLAFLTPCTDTGPIQQIARFRAYLDRHPTPRPVLEWGMRWLETHIPSPAAPVLCHHDFRTGNYMLDGVVLTGILDWEFAGWGDPHEDIGWFCCKGWRFARLDREAGGIADRAPFYHGYEGQSGRSVNPQRVFFWEVLASVRWAVIALQQSDRYMIKGERNLDLALTGRRATECELEILMLLDPGRGSVWSLSDGRSSALPKAPECSQMGDLPIGPSLLGLARDTLLRDLMPLLPQERQIDARLVANCMAIAEREGEICDGPVEPIVRALGALYGYGDTAPTHPASSAGEGGLGVLRRFAHDLRVGAFEVSAVQARDVLWQLTIARLRRANPRFLAANGFR
jgi:aminoglycoside phosphotransferase (APT) family kinase protein